MPVASGAAAVSLPHVGSKVNGCASARCVLCLVKFRRSVAPIKRDNNSCMGKMVGDVCATPQSDAVSWGTYVFGDARCSGNSGEGEHYRNIIRRTEDAGGTRYYLDREIVDQTTALLRHT